MYMLHGKVQLKTPFVHLHIVVCVQYSVPPGFQTLALMHVSAIIFQNISLMNSC